MNYFIYTSLNFTAREDMSYKVAQRKSGTILDGESGGRGFDSHRGQKIIFASCGSLFPFTRADAQWVIHGFK